MKGTIFTLTILAILGLFIGCSNTSVTGPEEVTDAGLASSSVHDDLVPNPGVRPGVQAEPTACETIGIRARRVVEVGPGYVIIRVEADNGEYVRLWRGDRNDNNKIGDFDLGDIRLEFPEGYAGKITVDVERKSDSGIVQCDGSVTVDVPRLPPPPPPVCQGDCEPPPPPPCEPGAPIIRLERVIGEWGECEEGVQTRTVTTNAYRHDNCSEEELVNSSVKYEKQECEVEEEGVCTYNVSGRNGKDRCLAEPGYISWNEKNHLCELTFPGVSRKGFNLNPGKSAEGCLRKQDDDD